MLQYFNPLAWFRWFGQFVHSWLLSVPWREAPKAIPALILLLALCCTAAIAFTGGSGWRSRQISRQLASALERDDFETAELVLQRQISAKPNDSDLRYRLALVRKEQGASDEAIALMRDLVRFRRHEEAAQFVLREAYVGRQWNELSQGEKDEYGSLLRLIHEESPDDLAVKRLLAGYFVDTGRPENAVPLLVELSTRFPILGLQAAAIERALGNEDSAMSLAEKVLTVVKRQSDEEPANLGLAFVVAQNQLFLKKFDDAIRTLDLAARRAQKEQEQVQLRQALADSMAAYVTHIEQSPDRTVEERVRVLQMLQKALEIAPNNPRILTLIADQLLKTENDTDQQVTGLKESLLAGAAPGISHFIRGTTYLMKQDVDMAIMHLEIAAEQMPNSGAILNNLAVAMTAREDSDLEKALQLSNQAIEQTPNATPYFYETRGQILLRLERYLKAVPDFERALAVPELKKKAHEALAVCYGELGDAELSEQHRLAAERLAADSQAGSDSQESGLSLGT